MDATLTLSPLDRSDLVDALQDAYDELSERAHGKYGDYEPGDLAEIDAKLERWTALIRRIGPDVPGDGHGYSGLAVGVCDRCGTGH